LWAVLPALAPATAGDARVLIDRDYPDPTIVRSGPFWYAFATNGSGGNVQVMRSLDSQVWTALPDALPELPAWASRNFTWAPAVLERAGHWVLYFTARHRTSGLQCIGRAVATSVAGPYRDTLAQPFVCQMDRRGSIDPSAFVASDGRAYLLYKSEGVEGSEPTRIWSQALTADGLDVSGPPVQLAVTDQRWEEPIIEGPTMFVAGGAHWLLYAGSHWESADYAIGVARCAGPQGPCMKWGGGPLVTSSAPFAGPGSPDVVADADGSQLLTFHAWDAGRTSYRSGGQRKVRALPVRVENGWPVVGDAPAPAAAGYRMVATDGGIFTFGAATFEGSTGDVRLNQPIVSMATTRSGRGYWLTATDGGIFAFGDAPFLGSQGARRLNSPIVAMTPTPSGRGYWLVAADGGIFTHGDARFLGSTGDRRLNRPIIGMAATPSGNGYWLVASDGGIFAFGDASFYGSTGALALNSPIRSMIAMPWADGYWLVAADGGVFSFGSAQFYGSTGHVRINSPIVSADATPSGRGYWFTGADGGVYAFGDAPFHGSTGDRRLNAPVVAMAA
jgi:hypothetical protein